MKAIDTLLDLGDRYAEKSTWIDFALTKFCLFSMGTAIGMYIPREHRTKALCGCAAVFAATYIPLMAKLYRVATENRE